MNVLKIVPFLLCVPLVASAEAKPKVENGETKPPTTNGDTFSGGLQGLEIAPKVLTSVPYGNSRLSVWGHMDNPNRPPTQQRFFVMPVVMLVPQSAECQTNLFTKNTALQFKVVMWDEDIAAAVLTHLKKATENDQMSSLQVTTLPMEQLRLVWANSADQISSNFRLNTDWQSYAGQDNILTFSMVVNPANLCEPAVEQLKARPDSLGSLELQYVLHGTMSARKQLTVSGQHLLHGRFYAQLRNVVNPSSGDLYLNSDDLNRLASEAVSNVVATSTTDVNYVDSGDSVSLVKLVYDSLASFQQSSATMTPEMWKSTFWQEEWARPDKLTSYLNKVMTKDQGENHTVHVNDKILKSKSGGDAKISVGKLFSFGGGTSGSSETNTHVSEDKLKKWLLENQYEVQWTGEQFKVKPMDLHRLNTQQLAQKQNIAATYVQVRQTEYTYNVQVSFPGETSGVGNGTQSTSAINKRIDALESGLKKETADRSSAMAAELAARTAADKAEADSRAAAIAASQNAATQLSAVVAANKASLDVTRGKHFCKTIVGTTCEAGSTLVLCIYWHTSGVSDFNIGPATNTAQACSTWPGRKKYAVCCLNMP